MRGTFSQSPRKRVNSHHHYQNKTAVNTAEIVFYVVGNLQRSYQLLRLWKFCELTLDNFKLKLRSHDGMNTVLFRVNLLSENHKHGINRNSQFHSTHTGLMSLRITMSPTLFDSCLNVRQFHIRPIQYIHRNNCILTDSTDFLICHLHSADWFESSSLVAGEGVSGERVVSLVTLASVSVEAESINSKHFGKRTNRLVPRVEFVPWYLDRTGPFKHLFWRESRSAAEGIMSH